MSQILANYAGRQNSNSSYIKTFVPGPYTSLWKSLIYDNGYVITPALQNANLYISGNLVVNGNIVSPSDVYLKDNIKDLTDDVSINIMKLRPTQFELKSDQIKKIHYGFIAQEFEEFFPELIESKVDKKIANLKGINYLEIIPLLVYQIQKMQTEIDNLKEEIKLNK
jgi:hypothetical protein